MTSVFVSGVTGFIAQHIVKALLKNNYKVVGSVRSTEKGEKMKRLLQSSDFKYEVVADVLKEGSFNEALKKHPEVTVFLHTASPFSFLAKNIEEDLLLPAVNGTKNALKAINEYAPQVKRVVVTSSIAAIKIEAKENDSTFTTTEETWNPITWEEALSNPVSGYRGSKTFAEKAAWEFVEMQKPLFVLSTVNPVIVFGPQAFDSEVKETLNTSAEIINSLLKLKPDDKVPILSNAFIDVRDVAKAHLVAFESDKAANRRLLVCERRYSSQLVLDIIHKHFPQFKSRIPLGTPGIYPDSSKLSKMDSSKTNAILGFAFIPLEQSVVDTVQQIVSAENHAKANH